MQHTTRQSAAQMIATTDVFTVATIDASGFPTTVALSPLATERTLTRLFFYTSRQMTTVQNIQVCHRATLFCYDQTTYSSLMLKGHLTEVGASQFPSGWQQALTPFQRALNYHDPVILQFQTSAIKVRQAMTIDHLELGSRPDDD
ncbi:pyridoxamine 5'-phosphate oxidase family protein [Lactiplantibacillus songbeiensis]|uniref:Pyridoxamine 5'-phosphate oxidase family protein n=1 Tax=Lactiplantibacillus songbeiensis TaxID=2559920 RepID=A0ABW4BYV1_9LACO|nr:pyridoxamine 5'-phosphate oxidase family protein [Lactiplantibacillus songbeiensis]